MKRSSIFNILFCLALGACSSSKNITGNAKNLKQEAKTFSLSIVQAYFSEDCDKVFNSLHDTILVMDGDGVFPKAGKEDKLCKSVKKSVRDKDKTYQDYLDSYDIEILSPKELMEKFDQPLPDYYQTTASDFFFIGSKLKEGKERSDNFIWDDAFIFMVRKENQTWTIKGVSG